MCRRRSHTRWLKPYSLSYQDTSLTKCSFRAMQALASKMEERTSLLKSVDTTWSSVYPRTPCMGPSAAALTTFLMSSILAGFSRRTVRSTTETLGVGTRKAIPVSLPLSSGTTLPTALAVLMSPSMMPKLSLMILARGARQLVVQEALLTTVMDGSYLSWLTPMTNMGASALGAEITTFLAPPLK